MLPKPLDKALGAAEYAKAYSANYGFEAHLVEARQASCLRFLSSCRPRTVLEVGCGTDLLAARTGEISLEVDRWQIVEPSQEYADRAAVQLQHDVRFGVTTGYLESSVDRLREAAPSGYQAVLLSSVLHETTDPMSLLKAARSLMSNDAWLLVNVPNALSMHRLLAVEMGLIEKPSAVSERNTLLGQSVVYDAVTLRQLLLDTGFEPKHFEGYMMKFLTNAQMQALAETIGPELIPGLDKLGQQFPANASEIAFSATLRE